MNTKLSKTAAPLEGDFPALDFRTRIRLALAGTVIVSFCWAAGNCCQAQDEPASPVPTPANFDSFHDQLAPYGNWLQTAGGWVWQPTVTTGWRPYYDGGHWINTDAGWYWQSDYVWGDIPFHYGRWSYDANYGWLWTPAYDFAPAWVCWRHADEDGYCGWAPLPPSAQFTDGGWRFRGMSVDLNSDFGLTAGYFSFVAYDHFWATDFRDFIVPRDRVVVFFGRSVFENHFHQSQGQFINAGLSPDAMARLTRRPLRLENFNDLRSREVRTHLALRENDRAIFRAGGRVDGLRKTETPNSREGGFAGRAAHDSNHYRTGGPTGLDHDPARAPVPNHHDGANLSTHSSGGSAQPARTPVPDHNLPNNPSNPTVRPPSAGVSGGPVTQPNPVARPGYSAGSSYQNAPPAATPNRPAVHGVLPTATPAPANKAAAAPKKRPY